MLHDLEEVCNNDPRKFWDYLDKLGPRQNKSIPMKVYDDNHEIVSELDRVLDKWKTEFHSLYSCPSNSDDNFNETFYENALHNKRIKEQEMDSDEYVSNPEINMPLSFEELERCVGKLKLKKAVGLDVIPNEVLKKHDVMMLLFYLYQNFLNNCILPSVWLKSIITPVPKSASKDPYVPLNYRGISLLSCVSKLFSSIINQRIQNYMENNNLFVDEQNGFRRNRSCQDHVFTLNSIIRNQLLQGKSTYCCFIDMQKAFDWVNRDLLFYKLLLNNIDGNVYKCIKALYNNPTGCVRLNDYSTDWFDIDSGVRQGDSLSPTLFGIFINDLAQDVNQLGLGIEVDGQNISILLYADDIVVFAKSEEELQRILDCISNWCSKWRLRINEGKSNIVHFRNRRKQRTSNNFQLCGKELNIVDKYKYLGIIMNEFLDYTVTADILAGAAGRALGGVISKFRNMKNVCFKTFSKLYHTSVTTVMDYCSAVWGFKKLETCDRIQQRATRYYLGVHQLAPILGLEGDIGWHRCRTRRLIEMGRMWNRFISMDDDRLTKKVFLWDYSMSVTKTNWCHDFNSMLQSINMPEIFVNRTNCDITVLSNKCITLQENEWQSALPSKPKLRTYVKFKDNFQTEEYVKFCYSRKQRSLLAQLRLGILPLHIETGRYRNKTVEERICELCRNQVENEIHFVCECPHYNDIRAQMYDQIIANVEFQSFSNEDKFIYLMKFEWKHLARYLELAWDKRKQIMYSNSQVADT